MTDSTDKHGRGTGDFTSASLNSSLLYRLKAKSPEAWRRMVHLFGPTVYQQCRSGGLQAADASDVTQDVFRVVATRIGGFHRNRSTGTFRGWLWTITRNKIADHWQLRQKNPEAYGGTDAQIWIANLKAHESTPQAQSKTPASLHRRGLELIQSEFTPRTWKAFWRIVVDGCTPAEVADELGVSVNSVYLAKSRVLRRLREELGDLLD